jgi:hypothetical protein
MTEGELATTPEVGDDRLTPASSCALLADFVDVLLPGDGVWPSARTVGVQAVLAPRLLEERGKAAFPKVMKALLAAGGPLGPLDEAARIQVVERFEAAEPALFGWLRDAAYVAYYENPFVAEVINASGHVYELRPHLEGYPLPRFDLERNTPRHGRGRYVATDQVRPVDASGLDLGSNRTQLWGLRR